jgi:hypothetical protein
MRNMATSLVVSAAQNEQGATLQVGWASVLCRDMALFVGESGDVGTQHTVLAGVPVLA